MKVISTILISLALAGCTTQTYHINGQVGSNDVPQWEGMQPFFVSGLGQEVMVSASEICGGAQNVKGVQSKHTFVDGFLGVITVGLFTPKHAKIYCK